MKSKRRLYYVSICFWLFALACAPTKTEKANSDNPKETGAIQESTYPVLNQISQRLAESVSAEEQMKWRRERAYWYFDHDFLSDLRLEAKKINSLDSSYALGFAMEALANIKSSNYDEAIALIARAKTASKGKDEAFYAEGELNYTGKLLSKSLLAANKTLEINQYHYRAYYLKGKIYLEAGDTGKAVSSLRTAVELNPDFYRGYKLLALTFENANKPLFKQYLDAMERIEPNNAEAKFLLADYFYRENEIEQSKEKYYESLALDEQNEFAQFNLGVIFLTEDLALDSARMQFLHCVNLKPNYTNAWFNLGLTYEYMDSVPQARLAYNKALEINPNYVPAEEALDKLN